MLVTGDVRGLGDAIPADPGRTDGAICGFADSYSAIIVPTCEDDSSVWRLRPVRLTSLTLHQLCLVRRRGSSGGCWRRRASMVVVVVRDAVVAPGVRTHRASSVAD